MTIWQRLRAIPMAATVRALERRVAELERNEHGHCQYCGGMTVSASIDRCNPDRTDCGKKAA